MIIPANENHGDWNRVEISWGTITETPTVQTAQGIRSYPELLGAIRFFIDAVDCDGGRLCVDSCEHYDEAIRLAEATRTDFEIQHPVVDLVVGGGK